MEAKKNIQLKRTVGLTTGISIILNCVIGSGIFISPKSVLINTNSIGMCLIFWVLSGVISMLGALCYAELGIRITESGAELIYTLRGFSLIHKRLGRVLAFINAWANTVLIRPTVLAIQSLTCANYLLTLIFGRVCGGPAKGLVKVTAFVVLSVSIMLNAINTKLVNKLLVYLASVKVIALIMIILGGLYNISTGHLQNFQNSFDGTTSNFIVMSQAIYGGLFAYNGWQNLNSITEEIKNPKRNLPLAIIIGLSIIAFVYILTNVSYFTAMSRSELLASEVVALTWADSMFSNSGFSSVISILIAISSFGSLTGLIYSSTRFAYVAAREGLHPKLLSMLNVHRHTPQPCCLLLLIMATLYLIPADIGRLINVYAFMIWFFVTLTIGAFLVIRFKKHNEQTDLKIPLAVPITFFVISIYIILLPIIHNPKIEYLASLGIVVIGLVIYMLFEYFELNLPFYNKFEYILKNILEVQQEDKTN